MIFYFTIDTVSGQVAHVSAEVDLDGDYTCGVGLGDNSDFIEILEDPTFIFSVIALDDSEALNLTSEDIGSMEGLATTHYWDRLEI